MAADGGFSGGLLMTSVSTKGETRDKTTKASRDTERAITTAKIARWLVASEGGGCHGSNHGGCLEMMGIRTKKKGKEMYEP